VDATARERGMPALGPPRRALRVAAGSPLLRRPRRAALAATHLTWGTSRPVLANRTSLPGLLDRRGLLGCAVEVGVKAGAFSERLLQDWHGRHLISVDPWSAAHGEDYDNLDNVPQEVHDGFHAEAVARLARFGERSSIWRSTGAEAAARIPHHCLDFVYLDARHDRPSVELDLADWYPKLRPGAVMAGHDYIDGTFVNGVFGVRSAVDAFFGARGVAVRSTFMDGPWDSWFVVVPQR
jgi:Methyltransferase domain